MKKTILLLTSAMFLAGCSLTGGGADGGIFRSDDGGKSFSPKNKAENNQTISGLDVLSIAINPQDGNELYIGTKTGGIFKTEDAGENWKRLKVSDLTPTKAYSMAVNPQDTGKIYAATAIGKRGKIMKSGDRGEKWEESYSEPADGTLVLCVAVDPKNPNKIFAGTEKGQIILSEDEGETWRSVFWTDSGKAVYKIAVDSADSDVAYFIVFQDGVLRTTDGGRSFRSLKTESEIAGFSAGNQDLENPVSIKTDPNRGGWLYVGTSNGLLRSKDRGESFETIKTLNQPDAYNILSIDVNPRNSEELIFTAAKTFYKSIDGGVNWLTVQSNSTRSLGVLRYNLQNPEMIFIGLNRR